MSPPRFSISSLMAVVLAAAILLAAARNASRPGFLTLPMTELLVVGALPMAIILGGVMITLVSARRRGMTLGFVVGGSAALLTYLVAAALATDRVHQFFPRLLGWTGLSPGVPLATCIGATILLLQLTPAVIGTWVGRRDRGPGETPRR